MSNHHMKKKIHENPEILGHTFPKAMTPNNIQFRVAGLVPVNRGVFEIVISCRQETYNSVHDAETPTTSSYTHNVWITP